ncbi:bifunctional DNA primase/polymerase [Streptomyces sp. BR1]|uniref:bifunctional DNA primase/polymerase n=1 Tax=Streptomyces sp. BR1 TaxID=1592323 RepID=UPI00402B6B73
MREILGRRRRLRFRRSERAAQLGAALTCATEWKWPVLPGVGLKAAGGRGDRGRGCACPDPECAVPGAHPFDPGLLAASTDERLVRWWWTNRPGAPVLLATGGRAPCALSLPAVAGARALVALDEMRVRLGPVVATPTRWSLLVAPYSMERLGDLLYSKDWVPSSLRFHGEGGYLVLPPSETGKGQVRWERAPQPGARPRTNGTNPRPGTAAPWLPDVEAVVDALVAASTSAPDGGSRLAY